MRSTVRNRQSVFEVKEASELMTFLLANIKDKTRSKIKSMLAHKQVKVGNEIVTQFNHELKAGDKVVVAWDKGFKKAIFQGLSIVFEDEDIIVVNKKSGLLSVGSAKEKRQTAYRIISNHIQLENPKNHLFVVHRLDRDASGLMVFAKNRKAQLEMQSTWDKTAAKRKYLVIAQGTIEKDKDTISSFLKESKALIVYSTAHEVKGSKKAVSHYEVIKKNEYYTLLEATQETERKHQLRAQLKGIEHPIVGDRKYEATENPLGRMALHAKVLTFQHPTTHKEVTFETKVPEDFLKVFRYKFYE
ncbi:MAG: RluA family pseudouridine synthase [Flavobacteriales bacterium]|nr:RluA family pseudouridine synthase [Flavobacteriales bacterium]